MSVLKGPADASHYRVKVGRYGDRWYTDPLPTCPIAEASEANWPSISTIKKAAGFDAAEYVVMKRLAARDLEPYAARPEADRYEQYKLMNKQGREAAFARGISVHAAAEARLRGEWTPLLGTDPGYVYLAALDAFLDAYQPELIAAECVAIHRDLAGIGYGGTLDAGVLIDGQRTVIDWKSRGEGSDHAAYPEEVAQVAAYIHAQYYIVAGPDGAERRRLEWDQGLIVSIKPDGYEVYPIV